jgi:hypothetical protein
MPMKSSERRGTAAELRSKTTRSTSMTDKSTSLLTLVLSLVVSLSISGCIGLTSATKLGSAAASGSSSGPPTTPPASHYVKLTWTPSASDAAAYNVYRAKSSVGPFSKVATTAAGTDQYTDEKVRAGETYYYVITAVTPEGMESTDSTLAVATVP